MKKIIVGCLFTFLTATCVQGQTDGKPGSKRQNGPFNMERVFKTLDKNGDGKISESEAPARMKDRFSQMDKNGDNMLTVEEMRMAMTRRMKGSRPGSGSKMTDNFKKKSGSGDGRPMAGRGMDLAKMFKDGDADGDGNLSPSEQKAIINKFNQMMARFRQMRGDGNPQKKRADAKKKLTDRYTRPNTDPVKPKRPGGN